MIPGTTFGRPLIAVIEPLREKKGIKLLDKLNVISG